MTFSVLWQVGYALHKTHDPPRNPRLCVRCSILLSLCSVWWCWNLLAEVEFVPVTEANDKTQEWYFMATNRLTLSHSIKIQFLEWFFAKKKQQPSPTTTTQATKFSTIDLHCQPRQIRFFPKRLFIIDPSPVRMSSDSESSYNNIIMKKVS